MNFFKWILMQLKLLILSVFVIGVFSSPIIESRVVSPDSGVQMSKRYGGCKTKGQQFDACM